MATKNISTYPVVDTIKDADKVVLSKDGTVRLVEIGTVKADMRKEIRDAKGEIQNELNSKTSATEAALDAESTARGNADKTLGERIDDEVEARTNADADLQEAIAAEEIARENADTNLEFELQGISKELSTVENVCLGFGDEIKHLYSDNGFCISVDGLKQVKEGYQIRKYPVTSGDIIYAKISKHNPDGAAFQFMVGTGISYYAYNLAEQIVGVTINKSIDDFIIVPDGANYLFVSCPIGDDTDLIRKAYVKEFASKVKVDDLEQDVNNVISYLYPYKATLTNTGGYLNFDTGGVSQSNYGKYTDEIKIGSYTNLKYTCSGVGNETVASVCFYDENREYMKEISIMSMSSISGEIDLTEEQYSSAKYVRWCYYDYRSTADFNLFNGELSSGESLDEKIKRIAPTYQIHGKNVLVFGDSITDCCSQTNNDAYQTTSYRFLTPSNNYTKEDGTIKNYDMWVKIFKDICEPKEIRNYARSGATYKNQDETRLSLSNQIRIALNDLNNPNGVFIQDEFIPDVIIFALGTNDGGNPNDTYESAMSKTVFKSDGHTVDVDATLSNLDLSKFNEAVRYAFLTVKYRFPMAQVFVSLPIQRNAWEIFESELVKDLERMAKRYGCIIIDATTESGIVSDTNTYSDLGILLKDGLHPNEYGCNLLARMFIKAVETYYMPMDKMNK